MVKKEFLAECEGIVLTSKVRFERCPPAEGFWFEELFKRGVMGLIASVGSRAEVEAKRAWSDSWGYGAAPFFADVGGLLTWPVAEGRFMVCLRQAGLEKGKKCPPALASERRAA